MLQLNEIAQLFNTVVPNEQQQHQQQQQSQDSPKPSQRQYVYIVGQERESVFLIARDDLYIVRYMHIFALLIIHIISYL